MNAYGGSLDMAAADIASYIRQGRAVAVLCASEMRCRSMYEALDLHDVPARLSPKLPPKGRVHIMEGSLSAGFELPTLDLTVITEGQIIARRARSKSRAKKTNRDRVKSYTDLTPGDLVVHEHHGIGRFVGMESITVDGSVRDFVKIAFAGTDFLYVPATSLDLISKYIGGGEPEKTRLSKLGGADWAKARTRAKAAAKQLAEGLLKLYAERANSRASPSLLTMLGSRSSRNPSPMTRPTTSCDALPKSRQIWNPTAQWTACCAAMSVSAKPKLRCVQ